MAKSFGYGLQAFAGGFQTGLGLGMENKKIKMLQEEQKRAEKIAKEKEENATNWYNTNKLDLANFHTQSQDKRNMLIFESANYKKEWTDYLRDAEDFLQSGDLESLKHLNDMEEKRIEAEKNMLDLGVRPENAFIGKYYDEKDMEYVKKLQIGKVAGGKTADVMAQQTWKEQGFGELPPEEKDLAEFEKKLKNIDLLPIPDEQKLQMKIGILGGDESALAEKLRKSYELGGTDKDAMEIVKGKAAPTPTTTKEPTPIPFKTLEAVKDSFKNIKSKAEYDSASQSYNASKEAKASGWTPPPFETVITDLIKRVENAFWTDYVTKKGKLKDKNEAEDYNTKVQQYLGLIEEAKNAGIDVSQFQAFIPYKELYGGIGNPLVTSESW